MKVILLQDIPKVGKKYEIKDIADGHALNFLIPKKLVRVATPSAIKELEVAKQLHEKNHAERESNLIENINQLKDSTITILSKANTEGHLFAGISKQDIVSAIKDKMALNIEENVIVLEKPIKETGEHTIEIKVGDKKTTFKLEVISGESE